jgi:hypothetical protein
MSGSDRDERGRRTLVNKGLLQKNGQRTGLVREDNQVRLGATRYPMACLYTCETVLSIAREGTSHHITKESVSNK